MSILMTINLSSLPAATGYNTRETYYGTRFIQGGRTNYLLDLSLLQILSLVPRPNPDKATVGNRRINEKHANDFATYLRATPEWVVPGIILRTERPFDFEPATDEETAGVAFGAISYQRGAVGEVHILDGQHRILGCYIALDGINADLARISELIRVARRNEDANAVRDFEKQQAALTAQAKRFESERIPVQVMVEGDPARYRQAFYDIAENAKGITASVRARFDSRKAVNRALEDILAHPLLANRVETETDRLPKVSPYITTAKHVIETVRALTVGYEGRIGVRVESKLNDRDIVANSVDFLDQLVGSFPPLNAVLNNQMTSDELRAKSMLGSPVFWRILAATRYELVTHHSFSREMVGDFYKKLAPHLGVPIWEGSMLFKQIGMPSFVPGLSAPSSRRQDAVEVVDSFVDWAITKPKFLDEAPLENPLPELNQADGDFELSEEEADKLLRPEIHAAREKSTGRASK